MGILDGLSSRAGDRTAGSNLKAAARCIAHPALLAEVVKGMAGADAALLGDCVEVCTEVAKEKPELVAPFAKTLSALLDHRATRVRWEAMHSLALTASLAPKVIAPLLPRIGEIVRGDASVIVRDYAVDALGGYAETGERAATAAYPILKESLTVWEGKHAARALRGLAAVARALPGFRGEIGKIGLGYLETGRDVVRKAARALMKEAEKP